MKTPTETNEVVGMRIQEAIRKRFGIELEVPHNTQNLTELALINERSVCRKYEARPLDEALIRLLCATAMSAPSKSDLQQAAIVRVCNPEKRAAINALMPGSPWIATAPEFLVFCGDHSRLRHMFKVREREFPNNHLDSFFNAAVDAGIVLATMVQAVQVAGLGCCPISEIRNHVTAISNLLELPNYVFPVAALTIGYPVSFEPFGPRLGLDASLHVDRYDAKRTDSDIAEYDQRRIRDKPYARQLDTARFGEAATYGWSEDKFRQYSDVQRADFGEYIRGRGFRLD